MAWKSQHASLESFSAGAYLNEMGITNFMRSTMAPPRGVITAQVAAGEGVFTRVGCAACQASLIAFLNSL